MIEEREPLRILIIHPHMQLLGGSEILTEILIKELASIKHEVAVLSSGIRGELTALPNFRVYLISNNIILKPEMPPKISKIMNSMYSVYEAITEFDPHVVLVMIQEPIYAVASKIVDPKIGCAIYIHFPIEEELTVNNVEIFLNHYRFPGYEELYKVADIHLTNSNYTAAVLYNLFRLESNVIYPAIEWSFFKEEPNLRKPRKNIIISVGRFVPAKRHDVLIRWFDTYIKPEMPDAELVIVGIPDKRFPEYYELVKELADRTADVVLVDRYVRPEEFIELYKDAKVYVHLRYGEHFGMAPVEAMSQGVIPVLPENSGLAELVVNGKDGFTARNDDEFIKYIIHVLKMSNEDLLSISRRAYRKAWYFNPDRFAHEVSNYLKIVARRH